MQTLADESLESFRSLLIAMDTQEHHPPPPPSLLK
jgi:hypothetical protein